VNPFGLLQFSIQNLNSYDNLRRTGCLYSNCFSLIELQVTGVPVVSRRAAKRATYNRSPEHRSGDSLKAPRYSENSDTQAISQEAQHRASSKVAEQQYAQLGNEGYQYDPPTEVVRDSKPSAPAKACKPPASQQGKTSSSELEELQTLVQKLKKDVFDLQSENLIFQKRIHSLEVDWASLIRLDPNSQFDLSKNSYLQGKFREVYEWMHREHKEVLANRKNSDSNYDAIQELQKARDSQKSPDVPIDSKEHSPEPKVQPDYYSSPEKSQCQQSPKGDKV